MDEKETLELLRQLRINIECGVPHYGKLQRIEVTLLLNNETISESYCEIENND